MTSVLALFGQDGEQSRTRTFLPHLFWGGGWLNFRSMAQFTSFPLVQALLTPTFLWPGLTNGTRRPLVAPHDLGSKPARTGRNAQP